VSHVPPPSSGLRPEWPAGPPPASGSRPHTHLAEEGTLGRRLGIACAVTALVFVLEVAGGLLTRSLALLSDAGHVFADLFALALSAYAFRLARVPPDPSRTFGYHRAEVFAAFVNGLSLLAISVAIAIEAWRRFAAPVAIDAPAMSAVAAIGLAANLGILFLLKGHAQHNLNVRSAVAHVMGDLLASVAVVAGGIAIWITKLHVLDPILSLLVVAIILRSAAAILGESLHILLEGTPRRLDLRQVERAIHDVHGVRGVHDLHIWSLCTDYCALSVHVLVAEQSTRDARRIVDAVARMLEERFRIVHTTIQPESESCGEACAPVAEIHALAGEPRR
jgi:cobalt-zinc-cadmium efflux system protein